MESILAPSGERDKSPTPTLVQKGQPFLSLSRESGEAPGTPIQDVWTGNTEPQFMDA